MAQSNPRIGSTTLNLTPAETDRLIIRNYTLADLPACNRLAREAFQREESLAETEAWLQWTVQNYQQLRRLHQPPYGDYAIALKGHESENTVIGSIGLVPSIVPWGVLPAFRHADEPADLLNIPEFGLFWAILPEHQKRGYATEAAYLFINLIFGQLNARRVVATTDHDNAASQRVMTKLGMALHHNPGKLPFWFEVVGVLENPQTHRFYI